MEPGRTDPNRGEGDWCDVGDIETRSAKEINDEDADMQWTYCEDQSEVRMCQRWRELETEDLSKEALHSENAIEKVAARVANSKI